MVQRYKTDKSHSVRGLPEIVLCQGWALRDLPAHSRAGPHLQNFIRDRIDWIGSGRASETAGRCERTQRLTSHLFAFLASVAVNPPGLIAQLTGATHQPFATWVFGPVVCFGGLALWRWSQHSGTQLIHRETSGRTSFRLSVAHRVYLRRLAVEALNVTYFLFI